MELLIEQISANDTVTLLVLAVMTRASILPEGNLSP
jgi:hypothetical protein